MSAPDSWGRLYEALLAARREGTGLVLAHVDVRDIPRIMGWLAQGRERSRWTPAERARHPVCVASEGEYDG